MRAVGYVAYHPLMTVKRMAKMLEASKYDMEAIILDRDGSLFEPLVKEMTAGNYSAVISCLPIEGKLARKLQLAGKLIYLAHSDSPESP